MDLFDPNRTFSIPIGPHRRTAGKAGRNDPCPCGGGKKYKRCCLPLERRRIEQVPPAVVEDFNRRYAEHRHRRFTHFANYGHAREAVHTNFKGTKFVAVGDRLHFDQPSRRWKTFHDFLLDYVRALFGKVWAKEQACRPLDQQHPVMQMHRAVSAFTAADRGPPSDDGVYSADANAQVRAFLGLAYDLFVLADNATLQGRLIRRLRHDDQYQGARHELFAAATCVRAGFALAFEDERDGTRKHPELLATHRQTGVTIAVEAKSRHRPGALGFKGTRRIVTVDGRAGMAGLFGSALRKEPRHPFVIFLDVNLPREPGPQPWIQEWEQNTMARLSRDDSRKFNLVICTNFPHHYTPEAELEPPLTVLAHISHFPSYPVSREALESLASAASLFGRVPPGFPE